MAIQFGKKPAAAALPTVDGILADFQKKVEQLNSLSQTMDEKAHSEALKIQEAEARKKAYELEGARATDVANKIAALIR